MKRRPWLADRRVSGHRFAQDEDLTAAERALWHTTTYRKKIKWYFVLTHAQRVELQALAKRNEYITSAWAKALLLVDRGYTRRQAAQRLGIDGKRVSLACKRFCLEGVDGIRRAARHVKPDSPAGRDLFHIAYLRGLAAGRLGDGEEHNPYPSPKASRYLYGSAGGAALRRFGRPEAGTQWDGWNRGNRHGRAQRLLLLASAQHRRRRNGNGKRPA